MGITQLAAVKALPYIMSNILALFTVLPLAIAVIAFANLVKNLMNNRFLLGLGTISYEIYLVHAFTLNLVEEKVGKILLFMIITAVIAVVLHYVLKKGLVKKNG